MSDQLNADAYPAQFGFPPGRPESPTYQMIKRDQLVPYGKQAGAYEYQDSDAGDLYGSPRDRTETRENVSFDPRESATRINWGRRRGAPRKGIVVESTALPIILGAAALVLIINMNI